MAKKRGGGAVLTPKPYKECLFLQQYRVDQVNHGISIWYVTIKHDYYYMEQHGEIFDII